MFLNISVRLQLLDGRTKLPSRVDDVLRTDRKWKVLDEQPLVGRRHRGHVGVQVDDKIDDGVRRDNGRFDVGRFGFESGNLFLFITKALYNTFHWTAVRLKEFASTSGIFIDSNLAFGQRIRICHVCFLIWFDCFRQRRNFWNRTEFCVSNSFPELFKTILDRIPNWILCKIRAQLNTNTKYRKFTFFFKHLVRALNIIFTRIISVHDNSFF